MKKQVPYETSNIAKRLAEYLRLRRISKAQLAKELGLLQPTVNGYFLEGSPSSRSMPLSFLEKVVTRFSDLDAEWLLRGTVSIEPQSKDTREDENDIEVLKAEIKRLRATNTMLSTSNETLSRLLANAINRG